MVWFVKLPLAIVLFSICSVGRALKLSSRGDDPSRASSIFQSANVLFEKGKLAEAVEKYRESIQLHPNADTYTNLGSALLDLEKTEDAIEAYELALGIDPTSSDAAYNLGLVYHDAGDERRAIELYKQCLRNSQERIDAWMNLASCFHALGEIERSIFAYKKVLEKMTVSFGVEGEEREEEKVEAKVHEYLGRALLRKRDSMKANEHKDSTYKEMTDEAIDHLKIAIALDPTNDVAKHMLASNSLDSSTDTAPQEYVKQLFDDYSDSFESSLANLEYRVPKYIAEEIVQTKAGKKGDWRAVVDLGCGTGLLASLLQSVSTTEEKNSKEKEVFIGVDLSPKMLNIAAEKGVYDILSAGDIVDFLGEMAALREGEKGAQSFEWVSSAPKSAIASLTTHLSSASSAPAVLYAAADVLVYIGELQKLFSALRRVMNVGDTFVFTVENADRSPSKSSSSEDAGWLLQNTGRYAHHFAYIEKLAAESGMEVAVVKHIVPRNELDKKIEGYLCILYRI